MPGVEVMPVSEAVKKYDWMRDYYWKAVVARRGQVHRPHLVEEADGYFIRALPGAKVKAPVQTCLMLKGKSVAQTVHNIIIVEEGAEMEVVTGAHQQGRGRGAAPGHQRVLHQEATPR